MSDPYAAPQYAGDSLTKAEVLARDNGALVYSTFWARVGAGIIDFLIVAPFAVIDYLYGSSSPYFGLYMMIPNQMVALFFYIYMVWKFGGTPGKLAMGLRIRMVDGSPISLKATILRYGVSWLFAILLAAAMAKGALSMPVEGYSAMSYMERSAALTSHAPSWYMTVLVLMQVWVWGSLITILCNKKRRAPHDFIANTAVIRK